MSLEEEKLNQKLDMTSLLTEKHRQQLSQILDYWEKMKAEWERKKVEFRWENPRQFNERLRYRWENKKELEKKYKFFGMKAQARRKFINKYLLEDMLYSEVESWKFHRMKGKEYKYSDWEHWKIKVKQNDILLLGDHYISVDDIREIWSIPFKEWTELFLHKCYLWPELLEELLKNLQMKEGCKLVLWGNDLWNEWAKLIAEKLKLHEWMELNLSDNRIGWEWMKEISTMELKDWVTLDLYQNPIGDEWAWYLWNIKLKYGVTLNLCQCCIWYEWVTEMLKNLKLKEWVKLYLHHNHIWDKWAQAIMDNLELKNWVSINLQMNGISPDMKSRLERWKLENRGKWIKFDLRL